jgi:hypothetical protein
MLSERKIKGTFCEEKVEPKTRFDKRSFRWKKSGRAWVLIGCPRGKWNPRGSIKIGKRRERGRCEAGTRAYIILRPAVSARCPTGSHRIRK